MATTQRSTTVVGVFYDASEAQAAVRALKQAGFSDAQIGVVSHDRGSGTETKAGDVGTHAAAGAATGVAAGAGVGALWALGIAAGMVPAIGPVIAGGLLASVLASAAGGAAIAGVVGALVGLGLPEAEAQYYEGEFKSGRTLVTVKAEGRYDEAWNILHQHGGYNQQTPARPVQRTTGATSANARVGEGQTVELHEEQLHATKRPVETGEVRVHKEVVTEQRNLQVPVSREEVVIERRPASGQASTSDIHPGQEIRIPVKEEQVHVEKEAVVTEEVHVGKRTVTDTETVGGTVRKEEIRVEKEGDVDVRGDASKKRK